jgi:hypothetical protein
MKSIKWLLGIIALFIVFIFLWNLVVLQIPINNRIKSDTRNEGISIKVHYKYYINPKTLVFNIKEISGSNSAADVFRTFLISSAELKDKKFDKVELAYKGNIKFYITGEYFNTIGSEYGDQNVVYTIRTFPENVYLPSGNLAYSTWSGGLLGVLSKQMDDFNDLCKNWFLNDL